MIGPRLRASDDNSKSGHGQLFLIAHVAVVNAPEAHQIENMATAKVRPGRARCRQTSAAATAMEASAMQSSTRWLKGSCGDASPSGGQQYSPHINMHSGPTATAAIS